jgi:hypothetical protein
MYIEKIQIDYMNRYDYRGETTGYPEEITCRVEMTFVCSPEQAKVFRDMFYRRDADDGRLLKP